MIIDIDKCESHFPLICHKSLNKRLSQLETNKLTRERKLMPGTRDSSSLHKQTNPLLTLSTAACIDSAGNPRDFRTIAISHDAIPVFYQHTLENIRPSARRTHVRTFPRS